MIKEILSKNCIFFNLALQFFFLKADTFPKQMKVLLIERKKLLKKTFFLDDW